MINFRQKLGSTLLSTISLVLVFLIIQSFQWGFVQLGAYISDFEGQIVWNDFGPVATSDSWNFQQVLWIYFFPFAGFLLFYILLDLFPRHPFKLANWILLTYAWTFLLVFLMVFFMPLMEIIQHKGIYYVLNWLSFSRLEQMLFGIILLLFSIFKLFRISELFSTSLIIPSFQLVEKKQITSQLLYLWFIPFFILSLIIFIASDLSIPFPINYFLLGIVIVLFINTWVIRLYNVIVK